MSFLLVAICWAIINSFCDYLIIGAFLAVLSQETFRYLFHIVTKKVQVYMVKIIGSETGDKQPSSRTNEIQLNSNVIDFQERISLSYGKFSATLFITDN